MPGYALTFLVLALAGGVLEIAGVSARTAWLGLVAFFVVALGAAVARALVGVQHLSGGNRT